jgi:hypothetical protein
LTPPHHTDTFHTIEGHPIKPGDQASTFAARRSIKEGTMKRISLNTAVGIVVALCGFGWTILLAIGFVRILFRADNSPGDIFFGFMMLMMAIPGMILATSGFRLFRATTTGNIKGVVGTLAVIGVFILLPIVSNALEDRFGLNETVYNLPVALIAIAFYVALSKFLMSKAGLTPHEDEFIGRGIILLVSFLIYLSGSALTLPYIFEINNGPGIFPDHFTSISLLTFGPILAAVLFFWGSMRGIKKRKPGSFSLPDVEGEVTPH